jgi:hypothetical protein
MRDIYFERNMGANKICISVGTLLDLNTNLALFYNLSSTEVYTDLEKYAIHWLNFMSNVFI